MASWYIQQKILVLVIHDWTEKNGIRPWSLKKIIVSSSDGITNLKYTDPDFFSIKKMNFAIYICSKYWIGR